MDQPPAFLLRVLAIALLACAVVLLRVVYRRWRVAGAAHAAPVAGIPILRGIRGAYAGAEIPFDDKPIVIGRDPAVAHLVFPPEQRDISGRHCTLTYDGSHVMIEDCGSTNGTFIDNGTRIEPGRRFVLKPGTRFYLGTHENTFELRHGGRL